MRNVGYILFSSCVNRPFIEEANKTTPKYSHIFEDMILFTVQKKPLPRAAKGTVLRKLALQAYSQEIEDM